MQTTYPCHNNTDDIIGGWGHQSSVVIMIITQSYIGKIIAFVANWVRACLLRKKYYIILWNICAACVCLSVLVQTMKFVTLVPMF